jgi:hypothetical protein
MKKQKYSIQVLGTVLIIAILYLIMSLVYGDDGRQWMHDVFLQLGLFVGIGCGILILFVIIVWLVSMLTKRG